MKRLTTLLALTLPLLAGAQDVWRCGADGRSYSSTPCAEGRRMDLTENRPVADLQAAKAQAARELRLAETLRRERLTQEAAQRGNGLGGIGPVAAAKPAAPTLKTPSTSTKKAAKSRQARREADGTWRAIAPASRQTKG